jgi:hypothetical protein
VPNSVVTRVIREVLMEATVADVGVRVRHAVDDDLSGGRAGDRVIDPSMHAKVLPEGKTYPWQGFQRPAYVLSRSSTARHAAEHAMLALWPL